MTEHRYPCTAEPPELLQLSGPIAGDLGNHRHWCMHDTPNPGRSLYLPVEHRCECGMTWIERPEPIDRSWIVMEPAGGHWGIWPLVGVLAFVGVVAIFVTVMITGY